MTQRDTGSHLGTRVRALLITEQLALGAGETNPIHSSSAERITLPAA